MGWISVTNIHFQDHLLELSNFKIQFTIFFVALR